MFKKIALIPAYEPDRNIIRILKELKANDFINIIVDDGSGKEYKDIFSECKKYGEIISYETNKGKGHALKTGIKYIKENYKNYIITTIDADGQHKVDDAKKLVEYAKEHKDEIVIGKRMRNNKVPVRSLIGNSITRQVFKMATNLDVYDTQTGLRCFSNELTDFMLKIAGERYEYEMNVLLEASKKNIKIKELEIQTIYKNNNSTSHFNAFKDSIKIYKEIIKFSLSSIASFLIDYIFYTIFYFAFKSINIANVLARAISSICNYIINRKVVFKSDKSILKSLVQYFLLVVVILALNTCILNIFVNISKLNPLLAKVLTEMVLFCLSWIVQKKIVFNKKERNKKYL